MWNETIEKRFWKRVKILEPTQCWEWQKWRTATGYGRYSFLYEHRMVNRSTHRLAYELTHGPIPDGMFICHRCDNPPCCNPSHLFVGTAKDNIDDAIRKGRVERLGKGEDHHQVKLTEADVRAILSMRAAGATVYALAEKFGVQPGYVSVICKRKSWTHLANAPAAVPSVSTSYHARKTHCRNGHEYSSENTVRFKGERACKICRRAAMQRWRDKQK